MVTPSVGQVIYVNRYFSFRGDIPNLEPFVVTDVAEEHFTAIEQKQQGWRQECQFDIATWTHERETYKFTAYRTEEDYWNDTGVVESEKLREQLIEQVAEKELPELLDIKNCIDS